MYTDTVSTSPIKKGCHRRMKSYQSLKTKDYTEQNIEELLSNKNFDQIESLYSNKKVLLELKQKIIIYRIKKLRNESALRIQKMWNRYTISLKAHKIAHRVRGCYTISPDIRNVCKIYIKIFTNEFKKEEFQIKRLHFCPIRNAFVIDIPKNKFYGSKKIIHFNFIKNNEIFFDDKYDKVLYLNNYVHQIDFSLYDKRQKILDETIYSVNESFPKYKIYNSINSKDSKDSNYLSTEDEKDSSESILLTPDKYITKKSPQFIFSGESISEFHEDEYDKLKSVKTKGIHQFGTVKLNKSKILKRFESFDGNYSCKSRLKSILKESSKEICKNRLNLRDSGKKVSFGETIYIY